MSRPHPADNPPAASLQWTFAMALCALLAGGATLATPAIRAWPQPPERGAPAPTTTQPESLPDEDEEDEPETELVLTDGRRVTGILVDRNDREITLRISGIPTPYAANTVAQIRTHPTVRERYLEMRRTIDDSDVPQRLRLAEWLRARRKYRLAFQETSEILQRDPANPEIRQLHLWLTEQLKLVPRRQPSLPPQPPSDVTSPAPAPVPPPPSFPLLTAEQINLIRIYEVDLNDPPRMLVDRDTITELLNRYSSDPAMPQTREGRDALYRKRPAEILELMFQVKARELYGRVQVQEDPTSMRLFRDHVHSTWLMNSCATTQCHGGTEAGRLMLSNKRPGADATVYTNFLILERFGLTPRAADQTPGLTASQARRLIDYDDPARSPLLQVGLPRKESTYPHPQADIAGRRRGFNPVFQSGDDRRFQDAVRWVRSMYRPRPDYPVQYDPPSPMPQTVPAGKAAPAER